MEAILSLGCDGFINQNITFCNSISNNILDLSTIKHTENYVRFISYLDHLKLFENTCINTNAITSALYKIHEFGYISEDRYKLLCDFYIQHKRCALHLTLTAK